MCYILFTVGEKHDILDELGLEPSTTMVRSVKIARTEEGYRINDMNFASKKFAKRYIELFLKNLDGRINNLMVCDAMHPKINYPLQKSEKEKTSYAPTFVYYERGELVLEDLLLDNPKERNMKIKMMTEQHSIDVRTKFS